MAHDYNCEGCEHCDPRPEVDMSIAQTLEVGRAREAQRAHESLDRQYQEEFACDNERAQHRMDLDDAFADVSNARHFGDGEHWRVFDRYEEEIMGPPRVRRTPEEIKERYLAMPAGIGREQAVRELTAALLHPRHCECTRCLDPSLSSEADDLWQSYQPVSSVDDEREPCECDGNDSFMLCLYCKERELEAWTAWEEMAEAPSETVISGCSQAVEEVADNLQFEFDREMYGARFL